MSSEYMRKHLVDLQTELGQEGSGSGVKITSWSVMMEHVFTTVATVPTVHTHTHTPRTLTFLHLIFRHVKNMKNFAYASS